MSSPAEGLAGDGNSHCCPACGGSGRRLIPRARLVSQSPNAPLGTGLVQEDCKPCRGRGWFGPRALQAEEGDGE